MNYEKSPSRHREALKYENPKAKQRETLGTCPRCGKNIFEGEKNFYCESGKEGCGFTVWKNDKFIEDSVTAEHMKMLLSNSPVKLRAKAKDGKVVTAEYNLEDTGKYVNLKRVKAEKVLV